MFLQILRNWEGYCQSKRDEKFSYRNGRRGSWCERREQESLIWEMRWIGEEVIPFGAERNLRKVEVVWASPLEEARISNSPRLSFFCQALQLFLLRNLKAHLAFCPFSFLAKSFFSTIDSTRTLCIEMRTKRQGLWGWRHLMEWLEATFVKGKTYSSGAHWHWPQLRKSRSPLVWIPCAINSFLF